MTIQIPCWAVSLLGTAAARVGGLVLWRRCCLALSRCWHGWPSSWHCCLAWAGGNLLLDTLQRRRDAALTGGIAAPSVQETEEVQALRARLATALELLKNALRGRGYLYQQPWYAIIGPPGAGKTTALLNAGLRFPLADTLGQGAVAGVGGTRLCDWWFTEDAVPDRHGGPLHHAGFQCPGRSCRLECLPGSAEDDQAAATPERVAGGIPAK